MKAREAHQLSDEELRQRLADAYQELFNLRFQKETRELANFARIRQVRKDIARIKTILRERELGYTSPVGTGANVKE
ncbi:MAG TPA: 50S ribosomal protein L29 [Chloroflexota bacterium]|jgi:large subunit ribosomal protein L29|nr:50S ribosomal protein L29 [Chloroflexota bacterium]